MCPVLLPLRQEETTAEIHKNQWIVTRVQPDQPDQRGQWDQQSQTATRQWKEKCLSMIKL